MNGARFITVGPLAVVLAAVPVHALLAWTTDLSPDEAYYLVAARQPSPWALVDHPPLLPLLLRATDLSGLPLELRVRVWPVALSFGTAFALVRLAKLRGADHAACAFVGAVASFALLPMAGGFVATPDAPLLFALAIALLGWQAQHPKTVAAALFAAALSKVVALPIALALALSAPSRSLRLAAVVGPALALPWLGPSLSFQVRHAFVAGPGADWSALAAARALGEAAAVQALLWSPWILARGWRGLRAGSPERLAMVGLSALVAVSAVVRAAPPEANWWAPAALLLLLAAAAGPWTSRARAAALAWTLLPAFVAVTHVVRPWLPLPRRADPTARLHGWQGDDPPFDAPGIGPYGFAAERCVYRAECDEISKYFNEMHAKY